MRYWRLGIIIVAISFLVFGNVTAMASENQSELETMMDQFDFTDVDAYVRNIFPDEQLCFRDVIAHILDGKIQNPSEKITDLFKNYFLFAIESNKNGLRAILLLVLLAALFTNFSNVFQNRQMEEMSFYIVYLLLVTLLLHMFQILVSTTGDHMDQLLGFIRVLSPVYFLAVSIATGTHTAIVFYQFVLLLIYLVEVLFRKLVLPLVEIYVVIKIFDCLSKETYLSKFAELLEMLIRWSLKTLFACVTGVSIIQGLLAPAIDSWKMSLLGKSAEALPIIGNAIEGMTEMMLGTAVLVKNGIGVTGAVVCLLIGLVPIMNMAIVSLMYKMTAAIAQPFSDKRIVNCISSISDGVQMLLKMLCSTMILFLLTIAVVSITSTGGR